MFSWSFIRRPCWKRRHRAELLSITVRLRLSRIVMIHTTVQRISVSFHIFRFLQSYFRHHHWTKSQTIKQRNMLILPHKLLCERLGDGGGAEEASLAEQKFIVMHLCCTSVIKVTKNHEVLRTWQTLSIINMLCNNTASNPDNEINLLFIFRGYKHLLGLTLKVLLRIISHKKLAAISTKQAQTLSSTCVLFIQQI